MLNNKGRRQLRHLPAARKWPSLETGVIRLPATEVRGGWAPGWYDWTPWEVTGFDLHGETVFVRSLSDQRVQTTISAGQLLSFEEVMPFGKPNRSRPIPPQKWFEKRKHNPRYV